MKKLILSITVMCYLLVSTGFIVSTHFCMNRPASVHLFETPAKHCGECGMETRNADGCCRDEVSIVKLTQDQNKAQVFSFELKWLQAPVVVPSDYFTGVFPAFDYDYSPFILPPIRSEKDTWLKNNVFRI